MTTTDLDRLVDALKADLPHSTIDREEVRAGRYRLLVIDEAFEDVDHAIRQRRVWDIADQVLPGQTLLDVAMIITMSPSEAPAVR